MSRHTALTLEAAAGNCSSPARPRAKSGCSAA